MKKLSLLLFGLLLLNTTFSQSEAKYPGGLKELYKHIGGTIKYPKKAYKKNIEGTVYIDFLITKDGTMGGFFIKSKSTSNSLLKAEALRVIKTVPKKWIPAMNENNVAVVSSMVIPISFKLKDM